MKIIIVGGGASGWMSAAALSKAFRNVDIHLVESSDIPTIGVGEATIPPFIAFLQYLEVDVNEFLLRTEGTFKLGINFKDWLEVGHSYFHPFGEVGANVGPSSFFDYWNRARKLGLDIGYTDFSVASAMAQQSRFLPRDLAPPKNFIAQSSHAYHFDAGLAAEYFKEYAIARGATRHVANVDCVKVSAEQGITELCLNSGVSLEGDLYLDCSGFKSLLIGDALKQTMVDWSNELLCDKAWAVQTEGANTIPSATVSHARSAGWSWHIPLRNRVGNGYVYSSRHISDEHARQELLEKIDGSIINEPRLIEFQVGHKNEFWVKNCVAIGLSGGFVEPLESTALHIVTHSLRALINLLPDTTGSLQACADEFNEIMTREYESIRDFIVLHYIASARADTSFWHDARNVHRSSRLQRQLSLYKTNGSLILDKHDLFKPVSWYAVLTGMGIEPSSCKLDLSMHMSERELCHALQSLHQRIVSDVKVAPAHGDFIECLSGSIGS